MINGLKKEMVKKKVQFIQNFLLNDLHLSHLVEVDQQKHSHRTFCGIVPTDQKKARSVKCQNNINTGQINKTVESLQLHVDSRFLLMFQIIQISYVYY